MGYGIFFIDKIDCFTWIKKEKKIDKWIKKKL